MFKLEAETLLLTMPVDICITTSMKALERVCLLANALAERMSSPYTASSPLLIVCKMAWSG